MATVLLGGFVLGAFLGNMPLFMAVIAEVIVASALKQGTLDWTSSSRSQWHPVFCGHDHRSVGDVGVTQLFQYLHLFHPLLHSIHLHINCKQGTQ